MITREHMGSLLCGVMTASVTISRSWLLAGTIGGQLRGLSGAAEKVQAAMIGRAEIPDFSDRAGEVGHLSKALRSMTSALYNRIEAIERFAADVAPELKNPLTSLRSAVETLPPAKRAEARDRRNASIPHHLRPLDRLRHDTSPPSQRDSAILR